MRDELTRLVKRPAPELRLPDAVSPPAIREKTGLERKTAADVSEQEVDVESTDGLFIFTVRVVKT